MSFDLNAIIRPNIRNLVPYSSARDEFKGEASVYLDANENSLGSPLIKWYNRYPDPLQWEVKKKLSAIKGSLGDSFTACRINSFASGKRWLRSASE